MSSDPPEEWRQSIANALEIDVSEVKTFRETYETAWLIEHPRYPAWFGGYYTKSPMWVPANLAQRFNTKAEAEAFARTVTGLCDYKITEHMWPK